MESITPNRAMLFDSSAWTEFVSGFAIVDGTFGPDPARYGFLMYNEVEMGDSGKIRFLFINAKEPMDRRFYVLETEDFSYGSISASPQNGLGEFVAVDDGRSVVGYKPQTYNGGEQPIDGSIARTWLVSSISKTVRVGASVFAVGGPLRIYKRIGKDAWLNHSASIPIPATFGPNDSANYDFEDLAGFSECDMYAVGDRGNVWRFDGSTWERIAFPSNANLTSVCCAQDGNVYITDNSGAVWVGRNSTWRIACQAKIYAKFDDSAWFDGHFWCANESGLWILQGSELVQAEDASIPKMPENAFGLCRRMDVSLEGDRMLTCGEDGAAIYDGKSWQVLFDRTDFEDVDDDWE